MADERVQLILREWSASGAPEDLCAAGLALLRDGRREELLDLLLEAWTSYPLPALGSWAHALALELVNPELLELRARTGKRAPQKSWTRALELCQSPADRSLLIELLPKGQAVELESRVSTLAKRWGAEPRLVRALTRWAHKPPYTSRAFNKAWQAANAYLSEHGDVRTARVFENAQHSPAYGSGGRGVGRATVKALKAAGRDAKVPNAEALEPLQQALEAHLAVHLDPPQG